MHRCIVKEMFHSAGHRTRVWSVDRSSLSQHLQMYYMTLIFVASKRRVDSTQLFYNTSTLHLQKFTWKSFHPYAYHSSWKSYLSQINILLFFLARCNVLGFGVITSDHIERAFRRVDRKFFVPRVRSIVLWIMCSTSIHIHVILTTSIFQFYPILRLFCREANP